ncbi:MAG: hypothetical protein J7493_13440 [Porphyrobacter sp.]|nr:hypothetical protein [Porphyrobacter sp.]
MSAQQARSQAEADYAAKHYVKGVEEQIKEVCAKLAPLTQIGCIQRAIEVGRDEERSERDLQAQETVARWTSLMGLVAFVGFFLSIFGIGLVWFTFRETKRTADVAERALEIETRPFVYLHAVDWKESFSEEGPIFIEFTFCIKNLGKLPATNLRVWPSLLLVPSGDRGFEHAFTGRPIKIAACPEGVTRKVFGSVMLDEEEASYFESMDLGVALGLKMIFDTRFTTDKTICEYRWANAYGLREKRTVFLDQPRLPGDEPDLFDEEVGNEPSHPTPPVR